MLGVTNQLLIDNEQYKKIVAERDATIAALRAENAALKEDAETLKAVTDLPPGYELLICRGVGGSRKQTYVELTDWYGGKGLTNESNWEDTLRAAMIAAGLIKEEVKGE